MSRERRGGNSQGFPRQGTSLNTGRQSLDTMNCIVTRTAHKSFLFRHNLCKHHAVLRHRQSRRGFFNSPRCYKSPKTDLSKQLEARIRLNGPITVATYMREGYYMNRDVFGSEGDFITSPEISQMFGELIGIWCINEWLQLGSPPRVQFVELGPGRGTLAADILRTFSQFEGIRDAVSVHLVEVSPKLSEVQQEKLCGRSPERPLSDSDTCYRRCQSQYGAEVSWYRTLKDVPRALSFYVAHEFFDALPIHIFKKRDGVWRELLVDIDPDEGGEHPLRFVLSSQTSTASKIYLEVADGDPRDQIEVCPEAGATVQEISARVSEDGGSALIADYGHSGEKADTFRAFKEHRLHDPLCEAGSADLTADVDFSYLRRMVTGNVRTYGPVTQADFLHKMGIGVRLQVLLGKADSEQRKHLITGYEMLTNHTKMGERFKFFALSQNSVSKHVPAGFDNS